MSAALTATVWTAYFLNTQFVYCNTDGSASTLIAHASLIPSYRPFEFAFESSDGLGTVQHRRESGGADGAVTGAYGYVDAFGVYRSVEYVADANGFRAVVKTNEPGTAPKSTADATWIVQKPPDIPQTLKPSVSTVQLKLKQANYSTGRSVSGTSNLRHQDKPFSFPVLSHSRGVITIQLPMSKKPGKKTLKLVPRAVPKIVNEYRSELAAPS